MKTLTISEAQQQLAAVADLALQGETILIERNARLLVLQEFSEPIPVRPEGYFAGCDSADEIAEANQLGARAPRIIVP